jgi:hypothetical protein
MHQLLLAAVHPPNLPGQDLEDHPQWTGRLRRTSPQRIQYTSLPENEYMCQCARFRLLQREHHAIIAPISFLHCNQMHHEFLSIDSIQTAATNKG